MNRIQTSRTVADDVMNGLLQQIQDRQLKLGDKLPSEKELCETYGVSRVSVRTAIQKLQAQGYVKTMPGKGSYVTADAPNNTVFSGQMPLSRRQYLYFIEMRQAIELKCVDLMVERGKPEDFAELREAVEEMARNIDNAQAYTDADVRFHMALARGSGNELFDQIYRGLRESFRMYLWGMNFLAGKSKHSYSLKNHQAICRAIENRDAAAARAIIEHSMESNLQRYQNTFQLEEWELDEN